MVKAPLKWAGGKGTVLNVLLPLLPKGKRPIEPFVGSGTVWLNTDYAAYWLGDANSDLIDLYAQLQGGAETLLAQAEGLFVVANNSPVAYYRLREEFNSAARGLRRAALFTYLNRHGFNGLCRYNNKGEFNIPFGGYAAPKLPVEAMQAMVKRLQGVTLHCGDFEAGLAQAGTSDVVYCDPPYLPLSATSSFTKYAREGFGMADQERLARASEQAAQRGASVLVSNHDTKEAWRIYKGASSIVKLQVQRNISADGSKRVKVGEIIAIYKS